MSESAGEIYNMYRKNTLSDTLEYYEHHRNLLKRRKNTIKTIGVAYRRMYDGGVERVLSSLLHIWVEMDYKVILFTDEEPNQKDYDYPKEVQRVILPSAVDMRERLHRLEAEICARKVDVFIQNTWQSESVLWEMLVVKSHQIPFLVYIHGHFTAMYETASEYAMMSHHILALCDKVIAVSDANAKFYELCGNNAVRLENPLSEEYRAIQPVSCDRQNHHVLWIGRIAAEKRLDDALKIFAEVKKRIPDAELDVVGRGDDADENKAKTLCEELKIGNAVHFHGYQTEVSKYYQDSAVMLMTSEKEGYSYVLLESKAYGKPCVMYSLPYLSLVKDGKGIRTAQIGDIDGMAEQLCELLLSESLRCDMGREARESFDALCNYDHAAKWREIFEELGEPPEKDFFVSDGMVNMLLDTLHEGISRRIGDCFEYQVGEKALRIPRAILRLIRWRDLV